MDPDCGTDEQIEEWLHNKKLKLKYIDSKIQFRNFDKDNNLMRTERVDTVSLHSGLHANDEHEFRRNEYTKQDSIWHFGETV